MRVRSKIMSLHIDRVSFAGSVETVVQWAKERKPSYICFANVHMTMEADKDNGFAEVVNNADLVLADGKPIAAACKWLYGTPQERIAGMDFMPAILEEAGHKNLSVFLYGSTDEVLRAVADKINQRFGKSVVTGFISPPFRKLSEEEENQYIGRINQSGAHLVLVALGCPKQEKWMAAHTKQINAPLLGVGGAFLVTAGIQKRSPRWMQHAGLEWLYRLSQEPGRLFKRYLITNTTFLYKLMGLMIKKSNS